MELDRGGAEALGEREVPVDPLAIGLGQPRLGRRLHVDRVPLRLQAAGHPPRRPDEPRRHGARPDADDDPLGDGPRLLDPVGAHVAAHLIVDALGGAPQGELAQGDQVALAEEVARRALDLLGEVDLALAQPLEEVVRREVDRARSRRRAR